MVGRSDLFWYVSVCTDAVVVTFRGVIERFTAVWALMGLFSSTVDRIGNAAQKESILCQGSYRTNHTHWRVSCVSSVPLLANPLLQNLHTLFLESETSLWVSAGSQAR